MWPAQIWQGGICVSDCYYIHPMDMVAVGIAVVMALLTNRWRFLPIAIVIALLLFFVADSLLNGGSTQIGPWSVLFANLNVAYAVYRYQLLNIAAVLLFVFAVKRSLVWASTSDVAVSVRLFVVAASLAVVGAVVFLAIYFHAPSLIPRRVVERAAEIFGDAPARCRPGSAHAVAGLPIYRGQTEMPSRMAPPLVEADRRLPEIYTTQMGAVERWLSRPEVIRVVDVSRYGSQRSVAVAVVIDEAGDVVAASPYAGPRDLYTRAVEIASRWKFVPFTRDGKPTRVRLERMAIPVEGPEQWVSPRVPFPQFGDFDSTIIKLTQDGWERGLSLELRGDGSVTFVGHGDLVALHGRHCAVVPRETVAALISAVRQADFFSMRPEYDDDGRVGYSVLVALDDNVKEVRINAHGRRDAPAPLWQLIDAMLESVTAERWIQGNRFTAPSLAAERWAASPGNDDDLWMLTGVAQMGDVQTVKDLLAFGVPVQTTHLEGPSRAFSFLSEARLTALEKAARRGAFDIVRALLNANVSWSREALGSAYVSALTFGDLRMARELVEHGADPRAARGYRNLSPLMAAAESGLPEAVEEALKVTDDVNRSDMDQLAALHWAAGADFLKTVDSIHADRPRVIEILLRAGANIDQRGYHQSTPLASNWMGFPDVAAAFIRNGANVNAQDEEGRTPLMSNGSAAAVELLLKAGADPYLRNQQGQDALDVARADPFAQDIVPVLAQWMATHPPKRASR